MQNNNLLKTNMSANNNMSIKPFSRVVNIIDKQIKNVTKAQITQALKDELIRYDVTKSFEKVINKMNNISRKDYEGFKTAIKAINKTVPAIKQKTDSCCQEKEHNCLQKNDSTIGQNKEVTS